MIDWQPATLLTVGHSNVPAADFVQLVADAGVDTVVDVRTHPRSRYAPQFAAAPLADRLRDAGLTYVWMGDSLGGRPANPAMYPYGRDGRPDYDLVARQPWFHAGIARLAVALDQRRQVALMCTEANPDRCHRRLLVARAVTDPAWHDAARPAAGPAWPWDIWHLHHDRTATRHVNDTLF